MQPMIIAGFLFVIGMIVLELFTGVAVFGFTGGKAIVQRSEEPGKFWFSIALQAVFGLVLPAMMVMGAIEL